MIFFILQDRSPAIQTVSTLCMQPLTSNKLLSLKHEKLKVTDIFRNFSPASPPPPLLKYLIPPPFPGLETLGHYVLKYDSFQDGLLTMHWVDYLHDYLQKQSTSPSVLAAAPTASTAEVSDAV